VRILSWHVHGSYTTSLVQGDHTWLIPVLPDRGPDGRGRAQTWNWPANAVEITPEQARTTEVDVVVLQRPEELHHLAADWLGGRRPGKDVPAVYLEHNAPQGRISDMRHCAADRTDLQVVHVTRFNRLFWDTGRTRTRVIEHGIPDPGPQYSRELPVAAAVVNEPGRRGRVVGADLLQHLARRVPVDVFGMGTEGFGGDGIRPQGDVPQARMHEQMARRAVYVHPFRWTSLGLSLIEAMHLAMPVVALATTEAVLAVPPDCGAIGLDLDELGQALVQLVEEPELACDQGRRAREHALQRYGLHRFLADWDALLEEVAA
jgi:glycosyltransferase involved in cell wall biosynthesis